MNDGDRKIQAFNVYLHDKEIDTVFYEANTKITVEEVRDSLVNHDGYDSRIKVRKQR